MSLLDLALLAPTQPISVPLSRVQSFLDRYRLAQGFPEQRQGSLAQSTPAVADYSQIGNRAFEPENQQRGAITPDSRSSDAQIAPPGKARPQGGIDEQNQTLWDILLRRSGGNPSDSGMIVDRWGPSTEEQVPVRRRVMTPLEGPDTGDENPNADRYLFPRGYFSRLAKPESGGNYDAVNPYSGASGPYQFLGSTWGDLMNSSPQLGLTWDGFRQPSKFKQQHEAAIQEFTARNAAILESKLGRAPTAGELYALHFLGPSGGQELLSKLDVPLGRYVKDAVFKQNPWLEAYRARPGRALLSRLDAMMGSEPGE